MKINGHRGAAGIELENTMPSFKAAKDIGVDAIELDIQITKDNQFVVCHDDSLRRVSNSHARISELTYEELIRIPLKNGHPVPLFKDVLSDIGGVPVVVDIKTSHELPELFKIMDEFKHIEFTIVGWPNAIIKECKRLRPDIPAFVAKHYTPFGMMRAIRKHDANGINLNYIWLNPFIYSATQKHGYQIQAYTVNNVYIAKLIKHFYPGVWICTNHPDKFIAKLRDKQN